MWAVENLKFLFACVINVCLVAVPSRPSGQVSQSHHPRAAAHGQSLVSVVIFTHQLMSTIHISVSRNSLPPERMFLYLL